MTRVDMQVRLQNQFNNPTYFDVQAIYISQVAEYFEQIVEQLTNQAMERYKYPVMSTSYLKALNYRLNYLILCTLCQVWH